MAEERAVKKKHSRKKLVERSKTYVWGESAHKVRGGKNKYDKYRVERERVERDRDEDGDCVDRIEEDSKEDSQEEEEESSKNSMCSSSSDIESTDKISHQLEELDKNKDTQSPLLK